MILEPQIPQWERNNQRMHIEQVIFDQRCDDAAMDLKLIEKTVIRLLQQDDDVLANADYEVSIRDIIHALRKIQHRASFGGKL